MKVLGRPLLDDRVCPRCGARRMVAGAITVLCPSCLFATALDDVEDDAASDEPPFEIVTILARDPDAVTYLARGFASAGHVALKIIDTPDASAIAARIRGCRAQLLAMRHSSVARFIAAGRTGGRGIYLATEYVRGPSLAYLLHRDRLTASERMTIACESSDAVAALHAHGLAPTRIDASRIKIAFGDRVHATLLGAGSSSILESAPPDPGADVRALVALCRLLGIALPPEPYATIESVRAALQDPVA